MNGPYDGFLGPARRMFGPRPAPTQAAAPRQFGLSARTGFQSLGQMQNPLQSLPSSTQPIPNPLQKLPQLPTLGQQINQQQQGFGQQGALAQQGQPQGQPQQGPSWTGVQMPWQQMQPDQQPQQGWPSGMAPMRWAQQPNQMPPGLNFGAGGLNRFDWGRRAPVAQDHAMPENGGLLEWPNQ